MGYVLPSAAEPGDIGLAHSKDFYGKLIRLGEAVHWREGRRYNHAVIVVDKDAHGLPIVVQMAWHCQRVPMTLVAPGGGYVDFYRCPDTVDRAKAVAYAEKLYREHTKYAVLEIATIVANVITPQAVHFNLYRPNSLICSGLVARSWEIGGWPDCPTDSREISPAQLAEVVQ